MNVRGADVIALESVLAAWTKNFNLGHNFQTIKDKAFIFHMCIPYDNTFRMVPLCLTLWPWPWSLTYFWKNFNFSHNFLTRSDRAFWPDCKAIPAYGLILSVCLSVRLSTFWLTSAFKFVLGSINQYRLDTLHGNKPWWDLLNCDLSLWPWPWLFLFKVT